MHQQLLQQSINSLIALSSDELRDLLADDKKLDEQVDAVIKPLESSKDVILAENRSIAEANLEYEPKMVELRSRVQELSEEGKLLGESVKAKSTQLKTNSTKAGAETVLALLQTAAAESEEESENIVKQFLESELSVDAYLDQFTGIRKLMHSRKLKAEKMAELLRARTSDSRFFGGSLGLSMGQYAPSLLPTGFYPPTTSSGAPASMPYPIGPQPQMPLAMFPPHF